MLTITKQSIQLTRRQRSSGRIQVVKKFAPCLDKTRAGKWYENDEAKIHAGHQKEAGESDFRS
jgi:hypothetical protein